MDSPVICKLALEDGSVFSGQLFGAPGTSCGEVVFNTAMTGYQEVLTDPSYLGQIVTMTYPLMGNYGINPEDIESSKLHLAGFIVRELPPQHSNFRATQPLERYLANHGITALQGVDTRAITRRLRVHGALRGVLSSEILDDAILLQKARELPLMSGLNLASRVAGQAQRDWPTHLSGSHYRIVALDCGIKYNILRQLNELGCSVIAMSGLSSAEEILHTEPDGILIGNGPGDPTAVDQSIAAIQQLIGRVPIFGICLGHQLLGCALGAKIYKLKFGHHGANHPVKNLVTGRVEITSQNHGFAVDADSLADCGAVATHINLNDQSLEGFAHRKHLLFGVQYHPEAAPGPHDASYLFKQFLNMIAYRQPYCQLTLDS
ncbi:MAG: Carbamoyl-phosphate synthase small chain [Phycisphaerae bacterium]|nr:Carbamoyl-phosphate synthase small chain [Phycisphaerae bacterium]